MKRARSPSLLLRLLGVQLLALALIWALFSAYQFHRVQGEGRDSIQYDVELVATALARVTSVDPDARHAQALALQIRDVDVKQAEPPIRADQTAFRVWSAGGQLLAQSTEVPALPDLSAGQLSIGHHASPNGWTYFVSRSPDGQALALYAHADSYYRGFGGQFAFDSAESYAILAVLLTILLWITLRIGLRPLNQLAARVSTRQPDDLTPVEVSMPYREIDPLITALNAKILKIRGALDRERGFFADAAHELRTPLSAIAAQAHVVVAERDAAAREQAASSLQAGVSRAARVLNRLLLISRLDAADGEASPQSVDLAELVDDVVRGSQSRAVASGHRIALVAESLVRRANRESLHAALECLVDNALKYTPSATQIVLSVHADGDDTVLAVSDNGPGIPEALHEQAFTRFERLGRTDQEGSGLGLAIVQRVAALHGGVARIRAGTDGGCVVDMRLPLPRDSS